MDPAGTLSLRKILNASAVLALWLVFAGAAYAAPTISLSARIGPPTTKFTVSGSGFESNATVDIYFDRQDEGRTVTNGQGAFYRATIQVPSSSYSGKHWVTALERDQRVGAQKPFLVYTNWQEYGFDPTLSGFNPYENFLNKNNVNLLQPLWIFTLPAYSDSFSTPSIYNGMVFAGYNIGESSNYNAMYAFDAGTGTVLWNYRRPAATPVVEEGVLYSHDGYAVSALDAHSGLLIWRYVMLNGGGTYAGPTLADGKLFIGSGLVYALDAKTGSFLWSFAADGGEAFASSVAVANSTVYACASNFVYSGSCYALDEKTGSLLWKYQLQKPVNGSPAVANGLVFFGSDQIYALDAASGALVWSYNQAGGPPSVGNGTVYIVAGGLRALDAASGALLWVNLGAFSEGKPVVANGVVYVDSFGTLFAVDADTGNTLWTYVIGNGGTDYLGVAVTNGKVYATSYSNYPKIIGQLYAFDTGGQGSSSPTAPPELGGLKANQSLR